MMQNATVNSFCRLVSSVASTDCDWPESRALLPIALVYPPHDTAVITYILQMFELSCFSDD